MKLEIFSFFNAWLVYPDDFIFFFVLKLHWQSVYYNWKLALKFLTTETIFGKLVWILKFCNLCFSFPQTVKNPLWKFEILIGTDFYFYEIHWSIAPYNTETDLVTLKERKYRSTYRFLRVCPPPCLNSYTILPNCCSFCSSHLSHPSKPNSVIFHS